jgi:hypothetical protein
VAVDVSKECNFINQAILGGDVRKSLSGGIQKIADEVNNFEEDSTNQQNDYESNVNGQWNNYKENMDADEAMRKNNEDTRIGNENTRIANEDSRQTVYNDFRDMLNTSEKVGRLPYLFDGGAFGDNGDTGTWALSMDGGSF